MPWMLSIEPLLSRRATRSLVSDQPPATPTVTEPKLRSSPITPPLVSRSSAAAL
jgi:hypothetical protein